MKQAIEVLKTSRPTFYRWLRTGKLKGMKVGRQWRFYRDDIERFLKGEQPRIELPADVRPLIRTLKDRLKQLGTDHTSPAEEDEVVRAANLTILLAVAMRASDIHMAALLKEGAASPVGTIRYRIDGVLHTTAEFDTRLLPALVERWKYMAACDLHEKTRPQDGRVLIECSGQQLDLRVSFIPALFGESVTARILSSKAVSLDLDRIDYAPADKERLLRTLDLPWGIILVTGPTGCGKTTVLYSCLNRLAKPTLKAVSIEEPVEYALPWLVQIQVRRTAGVTFQTAVRHALRSDPDVIMIGELRNFEALQLSHQAALTGHLILTTLHAEEAAWALKRMVDMGSEPFLVSDTVKLVISQRLVRLLCPHCSVEQELSTEMLDRARELADAGGLDWDALPKGFRKPVGCPRCSNTGYHGRTVIAEMLEVSAAVAAALKRGASVEELGTIAVKEGMTTMAADGVRRAATGSIYLPEVILVPGLR